RHALGAVGAGRRARRPDVRRATRGVAAGHAVHRAGAGARRPRGGGGPVSVVDQVEAAGSHTYATHDVPVAGGTLRVGVWEPVGPLATGPDGAPLPSVVLVHGITASHRAWPAVVAALAGRRVVAPDLRGRGRSNHL